MSLLRPQLQECIMFKRRLYIPVLDGQYLLTRSLKTGSKFHTTSFWNLASFTDSPFVVMTLLLIHASPHRRNIRMCGTVNILCHLWCSSSKTGPTTKERKDPPHAYPQLSVIKRVLVGHYRLCTMGEIQRQAAKSPTLICPWGTTRHT